METKEQPITPLTWERAKYIIARRYGRKNWEAIREDTPEPGKREIYTAEAADLYCTSQREAYGKLKWEQACEEMRTVVINAWDDAPESRHQEHKAMEYAPAPEFKP